jgi:RNA polymerase sigma-70 factor (ECF subfamily)
MKQKDELSDRELMRRAAKDHEALSLLITRYRNGLYAFVYRYVGDRETAEDIVQETFLRAMRHRHKFASINYVSTWFFTIAANMAKSELQRRKRWQQESIEPEEGHCELAIGGPLPDEVTDSVQVRQRVVRAIGELPEVFRAAVLLRDLSDLPYEEIGRIPDCPQGTVKSRVNRGRLHLQELLQPLAQEVLGRQAF